MDMVFKKISLLSFTILLIGIISAALLNPVVPSLESPTGTCTCNSMVVRTSGWSEWYGGTRNELGSTYGSQPYPTWALFQYEVEASIAGDDPSACTVYQGVQDSWHKNGTTSSISGHAYGSGDTFGDDSPHNTWINRSTDKIKYYDTPGWDFLPQSDYNPDGVWYKLRFLAKITGTDGKSCEKKFDVIFNAGSNGFITTVPTLLLLGGSSSDCQRTKGAWQTEKCK